MAAEEKKGRMTEAATETASPALDEYEIPELKLVLGDPFLFDHEEVKEISLEGLFNLTAGDMVSIDRQMIARGYSGARLEVTRQYAMLVAAKVNNKPWEWLDRMKARDSIRLREMVTAFFYARG